MTERAWQQGGLVVVVGVDFSEGAAEALREALRLHARGAVRQIHAVHVFDVKDGEARRNPDKVERAMQEASAKLREFVGRFGTSPTVGPEQAPPRIGVHLRVGRPGTELRKLAANVDADLILIGPHRHALLPGNRPLGGTAREVVEQAHCSVAIARLKHYDLLEQQPEIEPPCPKCLQVRRETQGQRWWCDEHDGMRIEHHVYTRWESIPWAEHDSNVLPTGFHVPRLV